MRTTGLLAGIASIATIATGTVVGVTTAQADSGCYFYGNNVAYGCVDRHKAGITDLACDGHEVRVSVEFANGTSTNVFDPDGCGDGFGGKTFERTITRFRICADGVGCSVWRHTTY
jgi:hypothetical protein